MPQVPDHLRSGDTRGANDLIGGGKIEGLRLRLN
jgi:hypothetical protein